VPDASRTLLGPSSVRDASGTAVGAFAYLPWQIPKWADFNHRVTWQWSLTGLDLVQTRAGLLDASNLLEEAALDRYAFVRNAYFQRRRFLIYDGAPPPLPADKQSAAPAAPRESDAALPADPATAGPEVPDRTGRAEPAVPEPQSRAESVPTAPARSAAEARAEPAPAPSAEPAAEARAQVPTEDGPPPAFAAPLIEPSVPANYPAVLAAGAPRAAVAR
jgi:phospholipid-binding lipoprotein MlaA